VAAAAATATRPTGGTHTFSPTEHARHFHSNNTRPRMRDRDTPSGAAAGPVASGSRVQWHPRGGFFLGRAEVHVVLGRRLLPSGEE